MRKERSRSSTAGGERFLAWLALHRLLDGMGVEVPLAERVWHAEDPAHDLDAVDKALQESLSPPETASPAMPWCTTPAASSVART
ncbi:hypothetical protein [Pseudoroseomonas sp. WGS1072]|uniref:hypothetical protein n=1 Tax=Roseomonas sp. WGS1072 TaxID=3366816 RepID=UPI003BF0DD44